MKKYPVIACLMILAISAFVGCGGEETEDLGPEHGKAVTGKAFSGGSPISFPGADETVMPEVRLIDAENQIVARTTLNADGTFKLTGVTPGKYKVNVSDPMDSNIDSLGAFVAVPVEITESTTDLKTLEFKK